MSLAEEWLTLTNEGLRATGTTGRSVWFRKIAHQPRPALCLVSPWAPTYSEAWESNSFDVSRVRILTAMLCVHHACTVHLLPVVGPPMQG